MKRKLAIGMAICMMAINMNITTLLAADRPKVICDGTELSYSLVQPEISNDRVMVPIRETAEFFGMTADWDDESRTMTFQKEERTIVHTLDQKCIYVNGTYKAFDTASYSQDGRTMMPVRMLAEALGAEVAWDEAASTVTIKNNQPAVISAVPSKTGVSLGETITITALTSGDATSLRLMDTSGNVLLEDSNYTQSGTNRVFFSSYTPKSLAAGVQTITVCAGSNGSYFGDTSKSFTLTIAANELEILRVDTDSSTVEVDVYTDVEVLTGENATKVKITNDYNSDVIETTSSTSSSEGRWFDFQIKPLKTGTTTYTVYVGSDSGYSTNTKTFSLYGAESTSLAISSVEPYSKTAAVDSSTSVTITASKAAEYIKILDNSGNTVVSKTSSYTASGSNRIWEVSVTVEESGTNTYYAYAYDEDDESVSKSFTITGSGTGTSSTPSVETINVSESTVSSGSYVGVDVYTNSLAASVYILDENGNQVAARSSYSYESDGDYVWPLSFAPAYSQTYTVYAENSSGDYGRTTFYMTVQ